MLEKIELDKIFEAKEGPLEMIKNENSNVLYYQTIEERNNQMGTFDQLTINN